MANMDKAYEDYIDAQKDIAQVQGLASLARGFVGAYEAEEQRDFERRQEQREFQRELALLGSRQQHEQQMMRQRHQWELFEQQQEAELERRGQKREDIVESFSPQLQGQVWELFEQSDNGQLDQQHLQQGLKELRKQNRRLQNPLKQKLSQLEAASSELKSRGITDDAIDKLKKEGAVAAYRQFAGTEKQGGDQDYVQLEEYQLPDRDEPITVMVKEDGVFVPTADGEKELSEYLGQQKKAGKTATKEGLPARIQEATKNWSAGMRGKLEAVPQKYLDQATAIPKLADRKDYVRRMAEAADEGENLENVDRALDEELLYETGKAVPSEKQGIVRRLRDEGQKLTEALAEKTLKDEVFTTPLATPWEDMSARERRRRQRAEIARRLRVYNEISETERDAFVEGGFPALRNLWDKQGGDESEESAPEAESAKGPPEPPESKGEVPAATGVKEAGPPEFATTLSEKPGINLRPTQLVFAAEAMAGVHGKQEKKDARKLLTYVAKNVPGFALVDWHKLLPEEGE